MTNNGGADPGRMPRVLEIEEFSKLTCPPDREILRAVDREETDAGNTRPFESYTKRN